MLTLQIKDLVDKKFSNKNQFAKEIKVGYPAACKLYNGETTRISFDTLENICIALECTPSDIFISNKIPLKK